MTTTTYRCAACKKEVEVETDYVEDREEGTLITDIKPCEVCLGVAEEGVREESYDKGYQEGWQAGYDTLQDEVEEEDTGPGEKAQEYGRGFEAGLEAGKKEDTKDERY